MQAACCVSWRTLTAGRSHRGRNYIGPLTVDWVNATAADLITISKRDTMFGAATEFIADLASLGFPLVVASYKLSSAENVSSVVINTKICTQRKRVNGR
jgi:hypothetical protein